MEGQTDRQTDRRITEQTQTDRYDTMDRWTDISTIDNRHSYNTVGPMYRLMMDRMTMDCKIDGQMNKWTHGQLDKRTRIAVQTNDMTVGPVERRTDGEMNR